MESFQRFQQEMAQNPNIMQEMLNSPEVQGMLSSLTSNPEFFRGLVESNPALREVLEQNPELSHVLNDPGILRQTLEVARNPDLMREHMRNNDRALSNIEAHPEGFNALRRMYENVQEPLINAATEGRQNNAAPSNENPFANLFSTNTPQRTAPPATAGGGPNSSPLPNPWAPTPPAARAPPGAATGGTPDLFNMFRPGAAGAGTNPSGGMPDPSQMASMLPQMQQMLQQPGMQSMMQNMFANPQVLEHMLSQNPMLRQMMASNPQMRDAVANPDFMRQMLDPANLQAMSQLSALGSRQPNGARGGAFDPLGMGGMGAATPASTPATPPETLYATQLQQLQDMGFGDQASNVRALQATQGNVNAAVERLLTML